MNLQNNTLLQGGKYRIVGVLGQGGFGITYLAEQPMLERKVCIKEFFFKDYCEREESTSHVTVSTKSNKKLVERFRRKFLKEARVISKFHHDHIVQTHDIFEENNTAYYVMDYIEGESLKEMIDRVGYLPEQKAIEYIKEVASALSYIHAKSINHLDVKPGNIMLRREDQRLLLIDFGVSKQYDDATYEGTTTTPVGISHGYSPAEQYLRHGVQSFSPQSDVYALAATLYKLLTGVTPPEAIVVQEEGLPLAPLRSRNISSSTITAIEKAMKSRTQRTQSVDAFVADIDASEDVTFVGETDIESEPSREFEPIVGTPGQKLPPNPQPRLSWLKKHWWKISGATLLIIGLSCMIMQRRSSHNEFVKPAVTGPIVPITVNGETFNMIKVEGGTFTMGATSEQQDLIYIRAKPSHQVTLSSYYIGETEVTQALWKAVMESQSFWKSIIGSNPSYFKGDDLPVEHVSWNDCQDFISKLNIITGMSFRLPTEAEWEFAARGGNKSKHTQYSGSSKIDEVAWYFDNSGSKTHPVKTKKANELGIYDMSGNVWEWCQDWYDKYNDSAQNNPTGPDSGTGRVNRGGSWSGSAGGCRSSYRSSDTPGYSDYYLGLRLVLSE